MTASLNVTNLRKTSQETDLSMMASAYTLLDDQQHFMFLVPPEFDLSQISAQGSHATGLLRELNRRISGDPLAPCRQITVFNRETA